MQQFRVYTWHRLLRPAESRSRLLGGEKKYCFRGTLSNLDLGTLGRAGENRCSDNKFTTWHRKEKSLYVPIDDDAYLVKFLRPCKYYPDSTFALMQRYYRFKLKHPDLCDDLLPTTVKHVYDEGLVFFQPLRDQHGRRILVLEVGKKWKPSKVPLNDLFRAMQVALEAGMDEPRTQLNGSIVLLDMDGLSLTQILQFTPRFAAMAVEWVQECTAMRLKAIHIVNNSYLFNMLFTIFKPFLSDKLRKRIIFHNKDWRSLTSHVDPACLRPRYGGTLDAPDFEGNLVGELLVMYMKDFELANSYGYTKKESS